MQDDDSSKSAEELEAQEKELGLKLAGQYFGTKIAHNAACLGEHLRQNRIVERLAQRTQDAAFGESDSSPALQGDDMGVNVGNTITNYYGQQGQEAAESTEDGNQEAKASLTSSLGKAATIAALVMSSGGLGAGALALIQLANREPTVEAPASTDTDTQYELRIGGVEQ